jgi:hypothetical protein
MSPTPPPPPDPRYDAVESFLHDKYNGVIPLTGAMVQAVLDGLDEEGR